MAHTLCVKSFVGLQSLRLHNLAAWVYTVGEEYLGDLPGLCLHSLLQCSYTLNILNAAAWESARSWARPMVSPRIVVLRVTESPDGAVRFSHCQVNCISVSKISIYILVAKWSGCCCNQLCVYPKQCVSLLVPFQSPQTCWYWLNKHGR